VSWIVTGGAGYIGAHVVSALSAAGMEAVVVDDLSTGLASRLPAGVPLVRADVRDAAAMLEVFDRHLPAGVIHLAARKEVAESVAEPLSYYRDNLDGLRSVLAAAVETRTRAVLFSSSAAVYGSPATSPVTESAPTDPQNPYGRTKLVGEWMIRDAAAAAGFGWAALRYFNVAGAGAPHLRDSGDSSLVPRLVRAATSGGLATVYGTDYPTPDGTAVRDYIHVTDVADAHVATALAVAGGTVAGEVFNVGRGEGASVRQMIDAVGRELGRRVPYVAAPRRPGDPDAVIASPALIHARLGWRARYSLREIIASSLSHMVPA